MRPQLLRLIARGNFLSKFWPSAALSGTLYHCYFEKKFKGALGRLKVRTGVLVCVIMLPSLRLREMTSHLTHVGCLEHDSSQYHRKQFSLLGHRVLCASSSFIIVQGTRPDTPAIRLRAT